MYFNILNGVIDFIDWLLLQDANERREREIWKVRMSKRSSEKILQRREKKKTCGTDKVAPWTVNVYIASGIHKRSSCFPLKT